MTQDQQKKESGEERFFTSAQNDTEKDGLAEDWAALDRELAQMAQDTPDMPDDFHARWTEQIRAEAGRAQQKARTEKRRQWRYILSAAAVFVFLIGGTLLTRSWKTNDITAGSAMAPRGTATPGIILTQDLAADMAAEDTGAAVKADMAPENNESAEQEEGTAPAANWVSSLFAAKEDGAVSAGNAAAPAYEAMEEAMEAAPEEDAYAAPEEAEASVPAAAKGTGSAKAANSAAMPAAAAAKPTAAPTPETTAVPIAEPAAEPVPEPAEDSPFLSFLKDFGIFTLKALGVCILPALAAVLILRKRRK